MSVASPCIGVCVVDGDRVCEGCFRTLDEIACWSTASDEVKQRILKNVTDRVCDGKLSPDALQKAIHSLCKLPLDCRPPVR